tara:strand:+ start:1546 stop:2133 length:588 start_codon:yes stop_codon:yes gene_type:complete
MLHQLFLSKFNDLYIHLNNLSKLLYYTINYMPYLIQPIFLLFFSFASSLFFNGGRGYLIMSNTRPPYLQLGKMPVPMSDSVLDIEPSNSTFHEWRNMGRSGLDMRYGPDLAEAGPYFRADDGLSIADLRFLRDKFLLFHALRNPALSIIQKQQMIEYNRHLFPYPPEWSSQDVTGLDIHEGGLMDDWNFGCFDVL